MHTTHVWKTISTVTFSILWKYRCKRQYDSITPLPSNILPELWESLSVVVCWQYDNMSALSKVVLKKRKNITTFTNPFFEVGFFEVWRPMKMCMLVMVSIYMKCRCSCPWWCWWKWFMLSNTAWDFYVLPLRPSLSTPSSLLLRDSSITLLFLLLHPYLNRQNGCCWLSRKLSKP